MVTSCHGHTRLDLVGGRTRLIHFPDVPDGPLKNLPVALKPTTTPGPCLVVGAPQNGFLGSPFGESIKGCGSLEKRRIRLGVAQKQILEMLRGPQVFQSIGPCTGLPFCWDPHDVSQVQVYLSIHPGCLFGSPLKLSPSGCVFHQMVVVST